MRISDWSSDVCSSDLASACQYQVRFDADALVESTHWKPSTCAGFLKLEAPAAPPPVVEHKTILSADLLFGFGSVQLTPQGRRAPDDALGQLQGGRVESVEITGHADRIGSDAEIGRGPCRKGVCQYV